MSTHHYCQLPDHVNTPLLPTAAVERKATQDKQAGKLVHTFCKQHVLADHLQNCVTITPHTFLRSIRPPTAAPNKKQFTKKCFNSLHVSAAQVSKQSNVSQYKPNLFRH
jgi:hypothetical protein